MMDSLKKNQNQIFQNNLLSENINEIQVNNSLINYRLKENAHSRTLATIPDENQNSFLVGLTQKGNNSELVKVIYDELNKKITHQTILDFNTVKEKEGQEIPQINEINKIYPRNATDFLLNILFPYYYYISQLNYFQLLMLASLMCPLTLGLDHI